MDTRQLYDEGEENWFPKLHVGCGGIRLAGYINIDIDGLLADSYPEEAAKNETAITDYYARLEGDMRHLPTPRQTYADMLSDMRDLPFERRAVDKIIAIQCLEHLTTGEALLTLYHWLEILRLGGILVLSVPDMDGTLEMIKTYPDLAYRHLRGAQKSEWSLHRSWYTQESLCELFANSFFCDKVEVLPNFHFYPAIVVRATKKANEDNILLNGLQF